MQHLLIRGLNEQEEALNKAIDLNIPALLIGETGTGKTSLIKKLAGERKTKVTRVNLNGQTSIDEFVGKYILQKGEMVWVDGILTTCMRKGYWLLVDEINAALPEILFVLHSLLDDDRSILLSEKDGELIQSHENFRFFATMNPVDEYAGTKDLNKALLSRFGVVLNIPYAAFDVEVGVLTERVGIDFVTAKKLVTLAIATRNLKTDEKIFNVLSTRDLLGIASLVKSGYDINSAAKVVYFNKLNKEELNTVVKATKFINEVDIKVMNPYYTAVELHNHYNQGVIDERGKTSAVVAELNKQINLLKKQK